MAAGPDLEQRLGCVVFGVCLAALGLWFVGGYRLVGGGMLVMGVGSVLLGLRPGRGNRG